MFVHVTRPLCAHPRTAKLPPQHHKVLPSHSADHCLLTTLYCLIDNIVLPQVDCCIVCLPPHLKDIFQIFIAHPRPVNPSMLCPCAPLQQYIYLGVSSRKGQAQFDVEAAIQCLYAKLKKSRRALAPYHPRTERWRACVLPAPQFDHRRCI